MGIQYQQAREVYNEQLKLHGSTVRALYHAVKKFFGLSVKSIPPKQYIDDGQRSASIADGQRSASMPELNRLDNKRISLAASQRPELQPEVLEVARIYREEVDRLAADAAQDGVRRSTSAPPDVDLSSFEHNEGYLVPADADAGEVHESETLPVINQLLHEVAHGATDEALHATVKEFMNANAMSSEQIKLLSRNARRLEASGRFSAAFDVFFREQIRQAQLKCVTIELLLAFHKETGEVSAFSRKVAGVLADRKELEKVLRKKNLGAAVGLELDKGWTWGQLSEIKDLLQQQAEKDKGAGAPRVDYKRVVPDMSHLYERVEKHFSGEEPAKQRPQE
ncbi:MAG: hypothetical protein OXC07_02060 [Kistimonas sp.]|nr:hypothetical protein [Kistimonas sp.]